MLLCPGAVSRASLPNLHRALKDGRLRGGRWSHDQIGYLALGIVRACEVSMPAPSSRKARVRFCYGFDGAVPLYCAVTNLSTERR